MKHFFVSSKCVISSVVTLFILFTQSLTLITSDAGAPVTVLPFLPGASIDVYTQRDGKGLNESSDAFAPQELVIITAYLTYDETPVAGKLVAFQLYLPSGTLVWRRSSETDDNGLAFITYSIPSKPVFGLYSIDASASVEGETVSDTLWFRVGWLVEVLEVLPCDRNSVPKSQFEIGEPLYLTVKLQNIRFDPTSATLTVTVLDELLFAIVFEADEYVIPPNQTTVLLNLGAIPEWAHVGKAAAHVCALQWLGGPAYCPEVSAWFMITPPIPDVAIVGVATSSFEIYVEQSVSITVSVLNEYYRPQSFDVTVYANTTVIQTLTITNLPPYIQTNFTFIWDTYTVSPGNYTISAYATSVPGETDTTDNAYTDGTVRIMKIPVAAFTYSSTILLTGETITFNAGDSYDSDGSIVSYFWDFGDGTNATGIIATHAYTDDGTYPVTLTVTDDDGLTDTYSQNMTVLNRPPIASFTESATIVYTGDVIRFNASDSYDQDGVIVSYFWDFGDGTNTTGGTANHAYADNGTYTVTLTVTDDDGTSASTNAIKAVLNRPDIAVTNVTPSKTVVGQGYSLQINVTVTNEGDYTESFNVTVYANTTIIATLTNITLTSGKSTVVTFTWNTTDYAKGAYTMSAYAWPLPGEADTTDNTYTYGTIKITVPGDIDGDSIVDIYDAITLAGAFGSEPGDTNWNPNADINSDDNVDIYDAIIVINYGETYP